ncbi:MAG: glycoside hydrolase family 88 protein [Bacteroidales bacterium]|nr:glycoside hydrolase family 88 protein [Bacteroidales bacterium]
MHSKFLSLSAMVFLILTGCLNSSQSPTPLSIQMCLSEMQRTPNSVNLDFRTTPRWNYSTGVELYAMLKVSQRYNNDAVFQYVYSYPDSLISPDGIIFGYRQDEYNIDNVNAGKLLFDLYDITHEERFRIAADSLRAQMLSHPRTSEGGFWHKKTYPHQMWLDGLYMGAPFVAQWASRNNENVAWDMMRQFTIVGSHTYDSSTHLYRHAWNESRSQFWCDSITGQSQHAWGRANGWYMMAMTDILEFIPDSTAGRTEVLSIYQNLAESLLSYRDSVSGMWYQVLDAPYRDGNYLESTCSAMFIYSFLKGARLGFLPEKFHAIGKEAYSQFVSQFLKHNPDGSVSLSSCCAVAGLGGKQRRDGSYSYYLSEPVRDNDPKGIGPFILASLEVE